MVTVPRLALNEVSALLMSLSIDVILIMIRGLTRVGRSTLQTKDVCR